MPQVAVTSLALSRPPQAWRAAAVRALNWWTAELRNLLPARARRWILRRHTPELYLHVGRQTARLERTGGAGFSVVSIDTDINTAGLRRRFAGAAATIALTEELLLRCGIALPAAAEGTLAQIIPHQLERLIPLNAEDLRCVWRISGRLPAQNQIRVEIAVARVRSLTNALALAHRLGLRPRTVQIAQPVGPPLAVWSDAGSGGFAKKHRWLARGLESVALSMFLAGYLIYLHRLDLRAAELHARLTAAEARLQAIHAVAIEAGSHKALLNQVFARLLTPEPLPVLNELSRKVPLDAYVSDFEYHPPKLELGGSAAHATALLTALGASPLLGSPRFVAPITSDPGSAREHFDIAVDLRPRAP